MSGTEKNKPIHLLCEYAVNPIGIDVRNPRFSWRMESRKRLQAQRAYQILVASSPELLKENAGDLWDSGRVDSDKSINIPYQGKELSSKQSCYWKVRIWDQDDQVSEYSETAYFEMGLLNQDEWTGVWIGPADFSPASAPMFRREIEIRKPVCRARVYIAGLGYYELRINGQKVGDSVLDPGWTDYKKRVLTAAYDVTGFLKQGNNVLGVILGKGWYGDYALNLRMDMAFDDGTECSIVTDRNSGWMVNTQGPIVENSIYNGETYDARREKEGWDRPEYKNICTKEEWNEWRKPMELEGPGGVLKAQMPEPIKVVREMVPIGMSNPRPGIVVYDLGQNIAGWVRLKVEGPRGTKVVLKFAEYLNGDGTVSQENLRSAQATDTYILKGSGPEIYEPRFTYHGFRYIQMEGFPGKPELTSVIGCVVRTSAALKGSFRCSNPLINKIQECVLWTEADNLHSIPTDCPQRDERMGWLNDMTVRAEEALFNFDLARLYTKWIQDIADAQGEKSGAITDTAPFSRFGKRPADPVCSSYLIVPWLVYLHYDDSRILQEHYEGFKRWTEYLRRQSDDYIVSYSYCGDWASPINQAVLGSIGAGAVSAHTPGELISTGYFYLNAVLLSKMAAILGKEEDAERYQRLAENIKEAFNRSFLNRETCQYAKGSQASNAFALYLGLVPEEYREGVLKNLVRDIVEINQYHLTTGNLCSRYLMDVLVENGYPDVAYALAVQTTYPSWGYMIEKGATTIWERWEHVTAGEYCSMASHNHPMYGSISAWFYKYLGGFFLDEKGAGFKKMVIKPHIIGDLDFVECSVNTLRGPAAVNWRRTEGGIELDVTVPWNSTAVVYVPKVNTSTGEAVILESDRMIWKAHRYISGGEGMIEAEEEQEFVKLLVGSGEYHFKSLGRR